MLSGVLFELRGREPVRSRLVVKSSQGAVDSDYGLVWFSEQAR